LEEEAGLGSLADASQSRNDRAKPDTLSIQRETTIAATPDKVFAFIDDFHNWKEWAPQDRDDPSLVRTFSGASRGVGAVSNWQGKGESGKGRAEKAAAEK
jgi:uncharacterized protein YndB with AHSA1/START domain